MGIEMNEQCGECQRVALRWTTQDGSGSKPVLVMSCFPCAAAPVARLARVECPLQRADNPAA